MDRELYLEKNGNRDRRSRNKLSTLRERLLVVGPRPVGRAIFSPPLS